MTARFFVGLVYKFNQKFGKIEDVIGIALSVLTPQGQSDRFTHGKHVIGVALVISSEHRQIVAWRKFDRTNLQDGEVAPLNLFNKPEYQTKP